MSNSEPSSNSDQAQHHQNYRRHDHRHQQDDGNGSNNRPYHHQQRGYYNNFHQQQNSNSSIGADPNNHYNQHRTHHHHHHQGQRQENDHININNGMLPQMINFQQHHHHHHHHHNHHQHFQAHGNFPRFHGNNNGNDSDSNNNQYHQHHHQQERRPYHHHYNHNDNNNHNQGYRPHHPHHQHQQGAYNNQPRDYQSVQTHMEVISPGFSATIDIAHLLSTQTNAEDSLVAQIFKINPQVKVPNDTNDTSAAAVGTTNVQQKPTILLALDYHGVVDVVSDVTEEISPQHIAPICVVSYVGPFGPIRERTRQSLQQRVAANQISMGILVFKKLRDPTEKNIPDIEFVASKRHAVELLLQYNKNLTQSGRIVFADDSKDNVATVQTSQDAEGNGKNDGGRIKCSLFSGKTGDELRQFVKNETV